MAAKQKTIYCCSECGNETPNWAGKCPSCGAWNTLVEVKLERSGSSRNSSHARIDAPQKPKRLQELDIYDRLAEHNTVHWNWRNPQPDTRQKAAASPVFLTSANGVSETGELVNIDGFGNRVAPTLFGPEKVYFIIGQNKVEPDLHSAVYRARNVAGPLNARRLKKKTPCAMGDEIRCFDCNSPDRICQGEVILLGKPMGMKECHVLIVEENLGY